MLLFSHLKFMLFLNKKWKYTFELLSGDIDQELFTIFVMHLVHQV